MNIVVTCDYHFERSPDGAIWGNGPVTHTFWTRYLAVFDKVRLVARVHDISAAPTGQQPANGNGVEFVPVLDFTGPREFLLRKRAITAVTARAIADGDAVILRPGVIGDCLKPVLRRTGRPYGVEVIADPYDVFSPNAMKHPLRPIFRWWFPRKLRQLCLRACGAAYVTEHALQRRYPPAPGVFSTHYSDVLLTPAAFVAGPRSAPPGTPARLLLIGSLAQLYKAPDVLIDAVAACVRDGLALELTIVGGGKHQSELEARAASLGLAGAVRFTGNLAQPDAVRAELDRADLYVMPSRQEGLPRAMIEAMARGLPCIGSTVGGFPELLSGEDLVPPNDAPALARKIREVLADPARMARMSARNLAKAGEYSPDVLTSRREAFYEHVKSQTDAWLKGRGTNS